MSEQDPGHGRSFIPREEDWILFRWQSKGTEGFLASLCFRKITLQNRLGVCFWEVGGGKERKEKTGRICCGQTR